MVKYSNSIKILLNDWCLNYYLHETILLAWFNFAFVDNSMVNTTSLEKCIHVCMCIHVYVYVYPCAYVPHLKYQDTANISFSVIFIEIYFPIFLSELNSHVVWIIFLVIECYDIVQ